MNSRTALIVAHGQPSDPEPADAEIAGLAELVSSYLPGWQVLSATLASQASLASARSNCRSGEVFVYPLFMADGWFTTTHLPARLRAAGFEGFRQLPPMGLDPSIRNLSVSLVQDALARDGVAPSVAQVLVAAHGSSRSDAPAIVAREVADLIWRRTGVSVAEAAFIDQVPTISSVAKGMDRNAVCLPFFAANGGHVTGDLPAALALAGYSGRLLGPVGLDARVPELVAASLLAAAKA
jgi:sirohydrochlorin ferrochelatase